MDNSNNPNPPQAAVQGSDDTNTNDFGRLGGPQPQTIDRALAALVFDNYAVAAERRGLVPDPVPPLPGSWARMGDDELRAVGIDPALQHDGKSGFDASFYRDGDGNVALVYAGTDQGRDWKHNFGQGLGIKDAQYDQAIALAREAKLAFGDNLVLSGQSLGGGLAAAASMVNEIPAVTFNAAGVHDRTVERYGVDADVVKQQANDGLVRHYVVENDILTHLQENAFPLNLAMPDAPGARINLPDPDPLSTFERLLPWKTWPHRVQNHYIEAVMDAMDQAGYTLEGNQARRTTQAAAGNFDGANRLLGDAVRQLAPQRESTGLRDDERFFNTAASLAATAGRDGLLRIDHVVSSDRNLFAVHGALDDPQHRRSFVSFDEAARTPTEASTAQLREQESQFAVERTRQQDQQAQRLSMA